MKQLWYRLRRFFCGCPSRVETFPQLPTRGNETESACGEGVGTGGRGQCWVLLSSCGQECSESCPRFQTLWQFARVQADRSRKAQAAVMQKPHLNQRDGQVTEIHDLDGEAPFIRPSHPIPSDSNSQAKPITVDLTPEIHDAEHGAEHSQAKGNPLDHTRQSAEHDSEGQA